MKKLVLMAVACLSTASYAQMAKVSSADNIVTLSSLGGGRANIDEAKKNIDEALENSKSNTKAKTYVVAAKVYATLAGMGKSEDGLEKAKAFIEKAIQLDQQGDEKGKGVGKSKKDIDIALKDNLYKQAINAGIAGFDKQDYKSAKEAFNFALWSSKTAAGDSYQEMPDSSVFFNAALAAMQDKDWAMSAEYFTKCSELNYDGPLSLRRANYSYQQLGDSAKMEKTLQRGIELYPSNIDILKELIQFYLSSNRNEEALVYINKALEKDPDNGMFYYARGCLNEKIDKDKSISDYQTAIAKNPKIYNAHYNLGIIYYNLGLDYKQKSNDAQNDQFHEKDKAKKAALGQKVNELDNQSKDYFRKAIAPMNDAANVAADNDEKSQAYNVIKQAYYMVGDYDKSQEYANKMKEL